MGCRDKSEIPGEVCSNCDHVAKTWSSRRDVCVCVCVCVPEAIKVMAICQQKLSCLRHHCNRGDSRIIYVPHAHDKVLLFAGQACFGSWQCPLCNPTLLMPPSTNTMSWRNKQLNWALQMSLLGPCMLCQRHLRSPGFHHRERAACLEDCSSCSWT